MDKSKDFYRITVLRELDENHKSWFSDCRVNVLPGRTLIYCPLEDQAALYGMLQRIQSFGLPLAEVILMQGDEEQ